MSRSEIEAIVGQVQRLSPEEQRVVMRRITNLLDQTEPVPGSGLTYSEMFGAGRGSFATPAEADAFRAGNGIHGPQSTVDASVTKVGGISDVS